MKARIRLMLALAVSAVSVSAFAQQRVDTGNARDANNRIGSGGANSGIGSRQLYGGVSANDIVYGNVTAGREFHGIASSDPRAFRGVTSSIQSDRLIRGSAGSPLGVFGGGYESNANTVRGFYGDSRAVAPPEGYVRQGIIGGYVPAPPMVRAGSDLRLGDPLGLDTIAPIRPGQLMLPGPVDNNNNATIISASPLYGVRQLSAANLMDQQFAQRFLNNQLIGRPTLDDATIIKMRDELRDAAQPDATNDPNLAKPLDQPAGAPDNQPVTPDPLKPQLGAGGSENRINLMPAERQSAVYAQLQQRLKSYDTMGVGLSDAQRKNLEYNETLRAKKQIEEAKAAAAKQKPQPNAQKQPGSDSGAGAVTPGQPTDNSANTPGSTQVPGFTPPNANQPSGPNATPGANNPVLGPTAIPSNRPKPIQIPSLAEGIKVESQREMLQKAESLMKEGKWGSALTEYDNARQIAPNQPLILIGRANAELGATYYAKAEADIRAGFSADPALMGGQYDLRNMIGNDRLDVIVKELKEIAKKNDRLARPVFLLAYIAYNTGNERMAAGYLDMAEKRSGGTDAFYTLVRKHWVLPEDSANPDDQNK